MLAAIDLGIWSPGSFRIAAGLLDDVSRVKPALQMATAEFSFFVFFVAGALSGLFDFHLVMRKLCRGLRI